ncbi:MAG: hypothetical protein II998_04450 [Clostridia bacterium]|nr:hypothetical protein [Clostridia bacterium]
MIQKSLSLNGAWEMAYSPDKYEGVEIPFDSNDKSQFFTGFSLIDNAVPGFWEDMTDKFRYADFFGKLRINPEYGIQSYPISGTCPDMALPNVVGSFAYRAKFDCDSPSVPSAIHFDGVQNTVSLWINDSFVGSHKGYSTPFEIEIKDGVLKKGDNSIFLIVSNHPLEGYDGEIVSGLTNRAANEYTGGITGDVALWQYESALRDVAVLISKDCKTAYVKVDAVSECDFNWTLTSDGTTVKSGSAKGDFEFDVSDMKQWTPDSPNLYTLTLCDGNSSFERIFGVRSLTADDSKVYLNGTPCFMRGVCEHFYIYDTVHQIHDKTYYKNIIRKFKELGFNYIRFHTYIPFEEYMQASDELGIMMHVESPNNTSLDEWKEIVKFCRRHPSVVIYCCGNELQMDDDFIAHLGNCADEVHKNTDALFAPMSAMRGLEYCFIEPDMEDRMKHEPFEHCPDRLKTVGEFSDVYASYTSGHHSYRSTGCDIEAMDEWHKVYNRPRLSHEICIDGTYTDLSLSERYEGTRIGKTEMFTSLKKHLKEKGVLQRAPLYFNNSSRWQSRVRKHCFEALRRSKFIAGYDFLGPIDTHWHTFGYDVGMMNEFYELKPGESVRNVLMYNSGTVILNDLNKRANFTLGKTLKTSIMVSHYGEKTLENANLTIRLFADGKVTDCQNVLASAIKNGEITTLTDYEYELPEGSVPMALKLCVTLDAEGVYAENEWELYAFPEVENQCVSNVKIVNECKSDELKNILKNGEAVVLFGSKPFDSIETGFKIALAGRTAGNLATVIADHPLMKNMPHEGFCGWQFAPMLEGGSAVCFESDCVAFNPIIEVVSTHKNVIRQSALFEFEAMGGKLLVCSLNLDSDDPGAMWFKNEILNYVQSEAFSPSDYLGEDEFEIFVNTVRKKGEKNKNFALNANDKTAMRRKK